MAVSDVSNDPVNSNGDEKIATSVSDVSKDVVHINGHEPLTAQINGTSESSPSAAKPRPKWDQTLIAQDPQACTGCSVVKAGGWRTTAGSYFCSDCWETHLQQEKTTRASTKRPFNPALWVDRPLNPELWVDRPLRPEIIVGDVTRSIDGRGSTPALKKRLLCSTFSKPIVEDESLRPGSDFKTRLCHFLSKGYCQYGEGCYYAHSDEELRPAPPRRTQKMREVTILGDDGKDINWKEVLCPFFSEGCCNFSDDRCLYKHDYLLVPEAGQCYKTRLCEAFMLSGQCAVDKCPDAHGQPELRTPKQWDQVPGYKCCLCTFHTVPDLECGEVRSNCPSAHGIMDLRRLPLSMPPSLSVPIEGQSNAFSFADAHIHLEQVLLSRRYGATWFYKRDMCRFDNIPGGCFQRGCAWAHGPQDRRPRQLLERSDLEDLIRETSSLSGGTFLGCVQNCCELDAIEDTMRLVQWGREVCGGRIYVAFGIHPSEWAKYCPEMQAKMEAAFDASGPAGVAWGECGLDYYRSWVDIKENPSVKEQMRACFAAQAQCAVRRGLPLVVHSRDAEEDTLNILTAHVPADHHVYLHSFMGDSVTIKKFLEGWPNGCIGIVGCVSYPSAGALLNMAKTLPLDRILLETDGPHMAPVPHRGEESHPGHIPWIAEGVAKAKGLTAREVLAATSANFLRFYRL